MSSLPGQGHKEDREREVAQAVVVEPERQGDSSERERPPEDGEDDEERSLHSNRQHFSVAVDQEVCLHQDKKEIHLGVIR